VTREGEVTSIDGGPHDGVRSNASRDVGSAESWNPRKSPPRSGVAGAPRNRALRRALPPRASVLPREGYLEADDTGPDAVFATDQDIAVRGQRSPFGRALRERPILDVARMFLAESRVAIPPFAQRGEIRGGP
jgi:hypothetical protein